MAVLRAGYMAVALKLQEAAEEDDGAGLSAGDIRSRLSDAIGDAHRGTGKWAYYIDHFGDDESGDVIYSCDGDTCRAPYEISGGPGAAKCVIDCDNAEDVVPRTVYEPETEEDDDYAAMQEAGLYTKGPLPLCERYISKSERNDMPAEDFAGKGKSFPIKQPGDIMAAVRSLGRAGAKNLSPSGIKSRIISIAKRKGWTKYLPKSWRDNGDSGSDSTKEAAGGRRQPAAAGGIQLIESATTMETIRLVEAKADYEIKLIAPGKGSSAFYPAEVLKRDGPKVFSAGTHVYLNHPTAAEESARPEGDVANLAGVLTTTAEYHESHAKGPGLYARMKVFADHAQMVEEKAAHVGMSIRASGHAEAGKTKDGLPVLKELTGAESVDVVTRAGAGGMILTEAARKSNEGGAAEMDAAELKRLQESVSAAQALNAKLLERAIRGDAREEATRILGSVTLQEASKQRIIADLLKGPIPQKDGALDIAAFTTAVNEAAQAEGRYVANLTGSGRVFGMGGATVQETAEQIAAREARVKADDEQAVSVFESLMGNKDAAKHAAKGRAA